MPEEHPTIEELKAEIANLRLSRDRAEIANRAKTEFLSSMSHELRSPLNSIIGFAQVLSAKYLGDLNDKQMEYLGEIRTSGEQLLELINDVLDIAKIEIGKVELDLSQVAISGLLGHCFITVKDKCAKRRIRLNLLLAEAVEGLTLQADSRKLKRVIYDLLAHAVKLTPDGGEISVRANRQDKELILCVENSGGGIAAEDLERVFDEFYKSKIPGSNQGKNGLGLSLSKRLVDMHGGKVWAESEGPGRGSKVCVSLPLPTSS